MPVNVKKQLMKAKSLLKRGDGDAARRLYAEILEHYPQNAEARRGLHGPAHGTEPRGRPKPPSEAMVRELIGLYSAGHLDEALRRAKPLADQHRDDPLLQNLAGAILADLHRAEDAVPYLTRAVRRKPDYVEAHKNLGAVYARLRRHDRAIECYEAALRYVPQSLATRADLAYQEQKLAIWRDPTAGQDLLRAGLDGEEVSPFKMMIFDDDAQRSRERAQNYAAKLYGKPAPRPQGRAPAASERLKLGYFSADFHEHATMHLMIRLFELHDASQFDVFTYSFGPPSDGEMRRRLMQVTRFRDVRELSDAEIAQRARDDGIDIAIDLKGYTEQARPGIFARRAAAIQISYLGYPGTLGASFMDYIVADRILIPEEEQSAYAEDVLYLEGSYQINDDTRPIAAETPSREACGLPQDGFVFCCFNNTHKITPAEFSLWMRLLVEVPGSVLWLLKTNAEAEQNLRREAEKRDVDPERLVFAERVPLTEHLARHRVADLFLDTFNYNAHTTASDALWAGLPVLNRIGKSFPARVAASLLSALGLRELICDSSAEYEARALEFARNASDLAILSERLETAKQKASLFNSVHTTQELERAFKMAAERSQHRADEDRPAL